MADLFFYGTLRHLPLLEVVLGYSDAQVEAAELRDHAALAVPDEDFPTIEARQGSTAKGLLARSLSEVDVARLAFYEGGFVYDLKPVSVTTESGERAGAQVFFPAPGTWAGQGKWSLSAWEAEWAALSVSAARQAMAWFGRLTAEELAQRFPAIRIHAAARVAAAARPGDAARDLTQDVSVISRRSPYLNFLAVEEADLQFRRNDGTMSPVLNRAGLMVGEAAVVLPYDPHRDAVLLVEQFRAPVFLAGDPSPWVWEPVAGLIDPGETPRQAAIREAQEEAGLEIVRLESVGEAYSSTGSSGEYLHLFIGVTDLPDVGVANGVASEGEDISSRIVQFDSLMADVDAGRIRDIPLLTTGLWLARHRDRLRASS